VKSLQLFSQNEVHYSTTKIKDEVSPASNILGYMYIFLEEWFFIDSYLYAHCKM